MLSYSAQQIGTVEQRRRSTTTRNQQMHRKRKNHAQHNSWKNNGSTLTFERARIPLPWSQKSVFTKKKPRNIPSRCWAPQAIHRLQKRKSECIKTQETRKKPLLFGKLDGGYRFATIQSPNESLAKKVKNGEKICRFSSDHFNVRK